MLTKTLEIARDFAKQLHAARLERREHEPMPALARPFELRVVLGV